MNNPTYINHIKENLDESERLFNSMSRSESLQVDEILDSVRTGKSCYYTEFAKFVIEINKLKAALNQIQNISFNCESGCLKCIEVNKIADQARQEK